MQQFEITLKNEKIKSYKLIALLLIALNLAFFIFLLIADLHFYEASASLLLTTLYIIYIFYKQKKSGSNFFINEVTFFILAGCWVALQNYLAVAACVLLGILYHLSLQKLQFIFTDNSIKKMNYPQKEFSWQAFTNVLLRDSILTLDLKNNTLIQLETENKIDEIQFNEFAQYQLSQPQI